MILATVLWASVEKVLTSAVADVAADGVRKAVAPLVDWRDKLRNHDVQRAVEQSLEVASRALRRDYNRLYPDDSSAAAVFVRLSSYGVSDELAGAVPPEAWLSGTRMSAVMRETIDRVCAGGSPELLSFLHERLVPVFTAAFREVGLKGDPKVRSVVFESLLTGLSVSIGQVESRLSDANEDVNSVLREMGFKVLTIEDATREVLVEVRAMAVLLTRSIGEGPTLAYLRIDDSSGRTLSTQPVRTRRIVVGRGGSGTDVAVQLASIAISRRHAEVRLDGDQLLVEDLKSTHGTFVDGKRVTGRTPVKFGAPIQIGPYRLSFVRNNSQSSEMMTAPTDLEPH